MLKIKLVLFFLPLFVSTCFAQSQVELIHLNYTEPEKFEIAEITVSGTQFLDPAALISVSGLKVGDIIKIPGDALSNAINKLWDQGILGNVDIAITKADGRFIHLDFHLTERPRLSKFNFNGIKKGDADELKEKIRLVKGKVLTDAMLKVIQNKVKDFYAEKGFLNTAVAIQQVKDTTFSNSVVLNINITKNKKVKIQKIDIVGCSEFEEKKIKRKLKGTKEKIWYKFWASSKFKKPEYEEDKTNLITFYNTEGYRDALLVKDSIYKINSKRIGIVLTINEGKKYYFRNIEWIGNYVHKTKTLDSILAIKKGDIYNMQNLQSKLNFNPNGLDISSLYLDNGYLFFSVEPLEVKIEGDSIDVEMRIHEGAQAIIDKVKISGNTKTNDHVVLREIRTLPGQKFSRADIIRSQRELSQLGFFDPEKISIIPVPNPQKGTVDIEYNVTEKPSDQMQLSGGWGGFYGFVGTLGLAFNNFSLRNIPHLKKWSPLPSGDGQRFSVNFQANGPSYQNYSTSFTEPWLGGKKPHSFTVSLNHSISRTGFGSTSGLGGSNSYLLNGGMGGPTTNFQTGFTTVGADPTKSGSLRLTSMSVSLGKRLRWPDDYFTLSHSLSYNFYQLENYSGLGYFTDGNANNISFTNTLSRNSIDNPTFPRRGANMTFSLSLTPPYSLFQPNRDYSADNYAAKFKYVEYYKMMFDCNWFTKIVGNLVLSTRAHMGFLNAYNSKMGIGPFERFVVGGDGLSGFNFLLGSDVIGLRGYQSRSIISQGAGSNGGVAYNKYVFELRHPITLNPAATVFVLAFAEGGNNWGNYKEVNPFNLYKSAGVGARIFMPAFGMIGIDYGIGFDTVPGNPAANSQRFTFTIGQQIR